jgi:hypothetical protein
VAFQKGHVKLGGRKKGTPNKNPSRIREAILKAFDEVGGVEWLRQLSKSDPKTFVTLLAKVVPTESKISTDDGGPVVVIRDYTGKADAEGG